MVYGYIAEKNNINKIEIQKYCLITIQNAARGRPEHECKKAFEENMRTSYPKICD